MSKPQEGQEGDGARRAMQVVWMQARVLLAFFVFGVGSVLLAVWLIPVRLLCEESRADTLAQRSVSRAFGFFLSGGTALGLWRIERHGEGRLRAPGQLIIANHPTLIDVILLIAMLPAVDCVVKASAWRNPALSLILHMAGYLSNDGGETTVDHCVERLGRGRSVLLFPEGTRSPGGRLRPFRRGASHVALRAACPVVPVFIECAPRALGKDQRLVDYPLGGVDFRVEVGASMDPRAAVSSDEPASIQVRRLTQNWMEIFTDRLRVRNDEIAPS